MLHWRYLLSSLGARFKQPARLFAIGLCSALLGSCGSSKPAVPPTQVGTPIVMLSATTLAFGSQLTGTTTALSMTVSNTGSASLEISAISITGAEAAMFQAGNNCGAPLLAGGGECTITATFVPTNAAASAADISITSNAAGSPTLVSLSGTGVARASIVSAIPTSLTFSAQMGMTSAPQTVTLTNSGTANLTVSGVSLTGTNAADFAQLNTCANIAPAASCTISVTFTLSLSGPETASLGIVSNAAFSPTALPLSGQEVAGYAYVGKTGGIAQFAVSNSGTLIPLSPSEVSYSTSGTSSFIAVEPSLPDLYTINSGLAAIVYTFGAGGAIS